MLNELFLFSPEGVGSGEGTPPETTPPETVTPASQSTPEPSKEEYQSEAKRILEWDPFEPGEAPGEEASSEVKEPQKKTPPETPKLPADAPVPAAKEAKEPQPQPPDPVQNQLAEIARLLAESKAQGTPTPKKEEAPPQPKFNFNIPPAITNALLTSEDPGERAQALHAFANGLANSVYTEVAAEFEARQRQILEAIPRLSSQTVNQLSAQEQMRRDFYETFKDLPKDPSGKVSPEVEQLVVFTAENLAKEYKTQGKPVAWTPEFRNAVGQRVYSLFGVNPQAQQARSPTQVNGRVPKAPSFSAGSGSRGAAPPVAPSQEIQDIWDTFGYS